MANINDTSVVKLEITAIDSSGPAIDSAKKRLGDLDSHTGSIVDKMKNQWVAYGAAIATVGYAIKKMILDTATAGEEILKMSKMTGISTENLSVLKYQAQLSETSIEELTAGMRFFSRALTGMNDEGKDTTRLLREMGVTARDPYEALMQASKAISQYEDGAAKATLMMELFGRGGVGLTSMLNELASAESQARIEAEKAGLIWSKDAAEAADIFNDNITKLKGNLTGMTQTIGNELIPKVNALFDLLRSKEGFKSAIITLFGGKEEQQALKNYLAAEQHLKAAQKALTEGPKKPTPVVLPKKSGISDTDKTNIKWLEGMMKEAAEAQKQIDAKKKAEQDLWETKVKESAKYDEYMQQQAEKEIKRQEELNKRKFELDEEYYQIKKQAYEDSWKTLFDMANQIGGEAGQGLGQMMAGIKGREDIGRGEDPYTMKYNQALEHYKAMEDLYYQHKLTEVEITAEMNNLMIQEEAVLAQQKVGLQLSALQIIQGALVAFSATQSKENKAMFLVGKALSIAMIYLQGLQAAIGAAAAVAATPYVGPVLAEAAYAKWMAITYMQMALAAAVTFAQMGKGGGGGGGAVSGGGGGGYSYNQPTQNQWVKEEEKETQPSQVINYYYYGTVIGNLDEAGRALVPAIDKARADGVQ